MKRLLFSVLILLLLSLSCGPKTGVIEIHDWNFGGMPKLMEWLRGRVESFEKTHPGIRVVRLRQPLEEHLAGERLAGHGSGQRANEKYRHAVQRPFPYQLYQRPQWC